MNLFFSRHRAHQEASRQNRDVVRNNRSSGWTKLKYGIRRKWRIFWEVYVK